jgi:hypothetical protein
VLCSVSATHPWIILGRLVTRVRISVSNSSYPEYRILYSLLWKAIRIIRHVNNRRMLSLGRDKGQLKYIITHRLRREASTTVACIHRHLSVATTTTNYPTTPTTSPGVRSTAGAVLDFEHKGLAGSSSYDFGNLQRATRCCWTVQLELKN